LAEKNQFSDGNFHWIQNWLQLIYINGKHHLPFFMSKWKCSLASSKEWQSLTPSPSADWVSLTTRG
jgi:hypothetical protein